jgi:hypothetical protein
MNYNQRLSCDTGSNDDQYVIISEEEEIFTKTIQLLVDSNLEDVFLHASAVAAGNDNNIKGLFLSLVERWRAETFHLSSLEEKILNSNYQRIIGLGEAILPLIIEEMKKRNSGHWFWALQAITGKDLIPSSLYGNILEMKKIWFEWAEENLKDASA